jgi:hypothetical protein
MADEEISQVVCRVIGDVVWFVPSLDGRYGSINLHKPDYPEAYVVVRTEPEVFFWGLQGAEVSARSGRVLKFKWDHPWVFDNVRDAWDAYVSARMRWFLERRVAEAKREGLALTYEWKIEVD